MIAQNSGGPPAASPSDEERKAAMAAFRRSGFLQVENALPEALVDSLREEVSRRTTKGVAVGDGRHMSTVDLAGPICDPIVYANPRVFPIINDLLGNETRLNSITVVTARPGAAAQHQHTDHPPLFPETALGPLLPCYAMTLIVPLVDVGPATGTTAVWLGSHLDPAGHVTARRDEDAFLPETPRGSVYLMDYRLAHRGSANTTTHVRPILSLVYARPWFQDAVNFYGLPRLTMSEATRAAIPETWRQLFGSEWTS